ncbi:MAG TPA: undecaprenyl-diphosphate phosphatase [Candidatus Limnocylindrales bacterium]|nr:undecaprenyl-diphosphate phosphatase [Candidatus Limnocylindrales bacterium]
MDPLLVAAVVMGIVQGLTEFLPVSSSGHLILVPFLLGGVLPGLRDPFISSLGFSVILHIGTLIALLIYFARDWLRIVPAFFGAIRARSLDSDPDRRLAVLLAVATVPALIIGFVLHDLEDLIREPGLVATMLVVGAAILWLAERSGSRRLLALDLSIPKTLGIGMAQAAALIPGISRSGISISAALFAGLRREEAARFSFLMATPITAAAAAYEVLNVVRGDGVPIEMGPLVAGLVASFVFGIAAIAVLLRFLRTRSTDVFVAYRVLIAAIVLVVWLG